jgi:hypothetical protein
LLCASACFARAFAKSVRGFAKQGCLGKNFANLHKINGMAGKAGFFVCA